MPVYKFSVYSKIFINKCTRNPGMNKVQAGEKCRDWHWKESKNIEFSQFVQ